MLFALTPSTKAARRHGPIASAPSLEAGAVSAMNRWTAAAIAAASSSLGLLTMREA
ncbi:MAG TPA: hypothetical protein VN752_01980 [Solirubrobacterales bacterium]|nr:hypothetical protein [Solirubrobacterales bacterium]